MTYSNNIPISHTKVVLPRRRGELLTRPRLLEAMFEFLDKSDPGFCSGRLWKNVLLIDLGHHSDLPFCWLALDSLDRTHSVSPPILSRQLQSASPVSGIKQEQRRHTHIY
jgi:hypothetical protein